MLLHGTHYTPEREECREGPPALRVLEEWGIYQQTMLCACLSFVTINMINTIAIIFIDSCYAGLRFGKSHHDHSP